MDATELEKPESGGQDGPQEGGEGRARFRFDRLLQATLVVLVVVLWLVLALLTPSFLSLRNLANMMSDLAIYGVMAFGELFVIMLAGIDLSVGAVAALANVLVAMAMAAHWPIALAVLLGLGVGVGVGLINGFAVSSLGIPSFIVTLAGLEAFRGAALLVTGGAVISDIPNAVGNFATSSFSFVPNLFWVLVGVGLVLSFVLRFTRTGRYFVATGSSAEAARRAGINVRLIQYLGFTISSVAAAVAGMLLLARLSIGTPTGATGYELYAIAGVVIGGASLFGGRGSVFSTLLGTILIVTITDAAVLLGVNPFWTLVAEGVLITIVVYLDNLQSRTYTGF